jgi:hypothetical protein
VWGKRERQRLGGVRDVLGVNRIIDLEIRKMEDDCNDYYTLEPKVQGY